MRTREALWLVTPGPFEDGAFGSWFGRLASRYRMSVDELAKLAELLRGESQLAEAIVHQRLGTRVLDAVEMPARQ